MIPIDVQVGDTTLRSPSLIQGERLGTLDPAVLQGFYAQVGAGLSTGILGSIVNALTAGNFNNSIGVSGVIQGFGLGISIPDTPSTLVPSLGVGINSGFSVDFTPDDWVNQPDSSGPQ